MFYIYRITNLIDGKTYIGQHEYEDLNDNYMGRGKHLIAAQKKYGIKNFKKDILVFNISKQEHANLLEETFIAAEREKVGRENCYNEADGGKGNNGNKGKHPSEEARRKMSEAHKDKPHSAEWIEKVAAANRGKKRSEEQRRRMAEAQKGNQNCKGRKLSEETKRKISETLKKRNLEKRQ